MGTRVPCRRIVDKTGSSERANYVVVKTKGSDASLEEGLPVEIARAFPGSDAREVRWLLGRYPPLRHGDPGIAEKKPTLPLDQCCVASHSTKS